MKSGKYVIQIVEDDQKLRETIAEFLRKSGFSVYESRDGEQAIKLFFQKNQEIDLILLDVMLPGKNGYEVLAAIREYSQVPVIMVTSLGSDEYELRGMHGGADNYIVKPFRLAVLKAYVDALLSRAFGSQRWICCGDLKIDTSGQRLIAGDQEIMLTYREFALLLFFAQHPDQVLTREQILDGVWGYDYEGNIRTVDTLVKQLRRKLTNRFPYIHAVYGAGYCFREEKGSAL